MRDIFIRLYLDEDVSVLVADILRARGFAVLTTREAGRLGASDSAQLNSAVSERSAILTHNRADFEALHKCWLDKGARHWGVIVAKRRPPHAIVGCLLPLLDQVAADEMAGQLRYI